MGSRKKILIFLFLIFLSSLLHAQWRFGALQLGFGTNISEDNTSTIEHEMNIGNISFDISSLHEKIIPGLGVTWIPFNIKNIYDNNYISIINFQIYLDIFRLIGVDTNFVYSRSILSPFVSVNYAPNFDFNNYILCSGIRYILTTGGNTGSDLLILECYYRLFENKNYIYFGITFDLIISPSIFLVLFAGA